MFLAAAAVLLLAPAPPEVLPRVQAWLDGTRTLEGRFQQTLESGVVDAGLTEKGKVYLERPGKMRWDYRDPEVKVALVVGDRTELYLAEDRQLVRGSLADQNALLPALLAGKGRIGDLFDAADAGPGPEGSRRLRLRPHEAGGAVEEVVLVVDPADGSLRGAEVLDAAGNRTAYRFSGWKRNGKLPPGIFAFDPPPGTEIVDSGPARSP